MSTTTEILGDGGSSVCVLARDCTVVYGTDQQEEYRDRVTLVVKPDCSSTG
ncbi:hypothetical protein [Salinarchaeum laminariae]|uniref:hypothetical protein n=1 Tax=Salinarchaeum laminariae TaxID=869888 RepID=UPI0020C0C442|nr:hypothetical protein [Salinarchaeum laminariae]